MPNPASERIPGAEPGAKSRYSITDLAREFGVTTRTIRFYEDQGLLNPARRGLTRVYAPRDRVRLRLVLRGKRLGFSLKEIGDILDMYDAAPGERGQLQYMLTRLQEQRAMLETRRQDIEASLAELDELEAQCRAWLAARTATG